MTRHGNYDEDEIQAILDYYCDLREYNHRMWILIRLADVVRLFPRLTEKERYALFYRRVMGLSSEEAGKILNAKPDAIEARCRRGIERLSQLLNGKVT